MIDVAQRLYPRPAGTIALGLLRPVLTCVSTYVLEGKSMTVDYLQTRAAHQIKSVQEYFTSTCVDLI